MPIDSPFVGEIKIWSGTKIPQGWVLCDGRELSIKQNDALFALLRTTYGGNGTTNFRVPDLRGRAPIHAGQGPGLSNYILGEKDGSEKVKLITSELPAHSHEVDSSKQSDLSLNIKADAQLQAFQENATSNTPTGNRLANTSGNGTGKDTDYTPSGSNNVKMSSDAITVSPSGTLSGSVKSTGGGSSHNNMQPYLALNYIISLQGIYPAP